MIQVATGALLAIAAAVCALRLRVLSLSGAVAAAFVGTGVVAAAGWSGAVVLFAFFIPSTILSKIGGAKKRALVDVGKNGARDAFQVIANGGIAAVAAALAARFGGPWLAAFAGAFAAASADTWGTEIGTLARATPRSIVTGRRVATGLSGGVTVAGTLAEIAGAAFVAAVAASVHVASFVPVFAGGIGGALVDSFLGAGAQALRYCPSCARECETNPHACGTPTTLRRGAAWLENDAVNLAATASGAVIAALLALMA